MMALTRAEWEAERRVRLEVRACRRGTREVKAGMGVVGEGRKWDRNSR